MCINYNFDTYWNTGLLQPSVHFHIFSRLYGISIPERCEIICTSTCLPFQSLKWYMIRHQFHISVSNSVVPWNMPMGLLPDKQNCGLRMRPGTFSPPPRFSDPDMHHGTCMATCMPGSLISGFLWSRCWGKRSKHSRRMHNPQFCVSGKRPMAWFYSFVSFVFSC